MNEFLPRLDALVRKHQLPWNRDGSTVTVELWRTGRRQRVWIERDGGFYRFTSVVLDSAAVTRSVKRWRDLAYRAWNRNARKDLVTFAFDEHDRLVGIIEQPAATLDDAELALYVEMLAKECDRFEYVLTGKDEG